MRENLDINSNDNTLFVTGRCNNNCIMCCQPPTKKDDFDFFYEQNLRLIQTASKDLSVIGISGGEPTLLGKRFFDLVAQIREYLPETMIHVLSNGRQFCTESYAIKLKEIGQNKISLGIPLHSDSSLIHDEIAGVKNAFNETILGLYNIAAVGLPIELRIVLNRKNYSRLPELSTFIFKNLSFVTSVSFMGMEYIGFAVKNSEQIWIEPLDYIENLRKAVHDLNDWNIDVSLFNLPLCLLPDDLHSFARKSISDWKNNYTELCETCIKKEECCGLFTTSRRVFNGLKSYTK